MRILYLTQLLPLPLDAGPKIRSYYTLRYLVEAGHNVTLASFRRRGDTAESLDALRSLCHAVSTVEIVRSRVRDVRIGLRSLFTNEPFLIARDEVPAMRSLLRTYCAERSFDAIHADQLWMAPYADCSDGHSLRVLDQHNAVYLAVERMAAGDRNPLRQKLLGIEANNLKRFERDTCTRFDKVVWVSEADRLALQDQNRTDFIIPIATDPSEKSMVRNNQPFRVTFLGGMHWPPNAEGIEWFAAHVWPTVAAAAPSAVLTVIGKGAPNSLNGLAPSERVEVTGYVDDVQPYLEETAVFVVPLLSGAGMRVKILDAWCSGLPVVSTTVGAEGIAATDREDMLIADSPESFAEATVRLLQNRGLARRIGEAGRATVERSYNWRQVYQAWDNVYR